MSNLKQQLYLLCSEYIAGKESVLKKIIADAQEAANEDTKSSAGDKFETGREVMQQEVELNLTRLNELNKLKLVLDMIRPEESREVVSPGALVRTNHGSYYIAISAGQLKPDGKLYYGISLDSPIGMKMKGQRAGDQFTLNDRNYVIESVN